MAGGLLCICTAEPAEGRNPLQNAKLHNIELDYIDAKLGKGHNRTNRMRHHTRSSAVADNMFCFGTFNFEVDASQRQALDLLERGDYLVRAAALHGFLCPAPRRSVLALPGAGSA